LIMTRILYVGNKLSPSGFSQSVIETLGHQLSREGFVVYYAGTYKNKVLRVAEILVKTFIIGRRADYILIDTYSTMAFWSAFITGMTSRLVGTKYIPILHGGNLPSRLKRSKRACDIMFKNSFKNVAVSGYLRHEFEMAGYDTITIPNSIDISLYPFRLREYPRPKLLWVRSFHKQYNPNMAADVLNELLKTNPEAELCMVGPDKDGSMERFRNYLKVLGISSQVKITGLLKKEEWINLSKDYDFFINTTNVDNTPVSVIEALSLGLTVISTNPGGIPYLLKSDENSVLVNCGDYKQMATQIIRLVNDYSTSQRLALNGRKLAEKFDWTSVKPLWFNLFS